MKFKTKSLGKGRFHHFAYSGGMKDRVSPIEINKLSKRRMKIRLQRIS